MTLKAINVEDEVLNYRFKVNIADRITVTDINDCNTGMKKMLNFAFVVLLYKLHYQSL
mgnify:CR=1 FL=1